MKTKISVAMAVLIAFAAIACDPKTKGTELKDVDTTSIDSLAIKVPVDSTRTGVQQSDSASVSN